MTSASAVIASSICAPALRAASYAWRLSARSRSSSPKSGRSLSTILPRTSGANAAHHACEPPRGRTCSRRAAPPGAQQSDASLLSASGKRRSLPPSSCVPGCIHSRSRPLRLRSTKRSCSVTVVQPAIVLRCVGCEISTASSATEPSAYCTSRAPSVPTASIEKVCESSLSCSALSCAAGGSFSPAAGATPTRALRYSMYSPSASIARLGGSERLKRVSSEKSCAEAALLGSHCSTACDVSRASYSRSGIDEALCSQCSVPTERLHVPSAEELSSSRSTTERADDAPSVGG
mmetsp:Transcript_89560/g.269193  ORF Transcript_89560/g.269193 Transcript_89560/m.269193 type:complete len:291 (+) Transcript_89560:55-927(+)